MEPLKVHHIGYAVLDLMNSIDAFLKIGYTLEVKPIVDEKRSVEIAFVKNNGYLIELISPLNDNSPIKNYLDKIGNTPYHICYETVDIEKSIADLRKQRYLIIEKPSPAVAINHQQVAFLYHLNNGLLELIEV